MPNQRAIIVSDAHLGQVPKQAEDDLHAFLERVPERADHLVINGDLFEFWFEYRRVIPRKVFPTLVKLRGVVDRGVRMTVLGGNHDRWGRDFWTDEIGAEFHRDGVVTDVAGWRTFLHHGDGLIESERGARWLHTITRWKLTESLFRAIHPDAGFKIIDRLSKSLANQKRPPGEIEILKAAQIEYAHQRFNEDDGLELIVLGHTHGPVLEEFGSRKRFLNPGAWYEGGRHAAVEPASIKLLSTNNLHRSS